MPSPQSQALGDLFQEFGRAFEASKGNPLLDRATYEGVHKVASEAIGVSFEDTIIDGIPCKWIRPADASPKHVMLYFHGGGFTFGSPNGHRKMTAHIAKATKCTGLSVDYRLTPENPYPAGLNDCIAVYKWILDNGFSASNIITAGDSCGGGLATVVPLAAIKHGLPIPAATVAISPGYDSTGSGQSMETNAKSDLLTSREFVEMVTERLLQGKYDRKDPLISPLFADNLGELPPHWISCAGDDMLRDDGVRLATKAKAAGAEVVLEVHPGMQHVFELMAGKASEADESIRKIGEWVQQKLGI